MTAATAPAPRRRIAPTARASTAATASSAAVPAITRVSVRGLTGRHVVAVGAQDGLADRDGGRGGDQPGDEGDGADHDGLGRQYPAAPRAGRERRADQAPPVLGRDEQCGQDDQHDQPGEGTLQGVLDAAAEANGRGDVARPA